MPSTQLWLAGFHNKPSCFMGQLDGPPGLPVPLASLP